MDVAVPAPGEGIRADSCEFPGLGAAHSLPLHHTPGGVGINAINSNNKVNDLRFKL